MRPDSLTSLLTEAPSRYGTVLHVGLYHDPVSRLFFGKGYAFIDTAPEDRTVPSLSHEIDLTNQQLIYASWRATVGEKHTLYDDPLPTIPTSTSSLNLGSSSAQNSSSPTPIASVVSKSKASATIITAVTPEEEDDADDTDYVSSDGQSESDEPEHDSDVMSIDSRETRYRRRCTSSTE
ncbi:uncharacterized protein RHIMIDRAFT_249858 [Rhizopus microsporus ATCC 52813]|uniref:Uncharacterized protein n=1 Tax=Rhizopus microsporus ATCC 52813 TaxID=1340429 RepID=A0A2G4T1S7_RHIZD|nr:uncharacterized protein RHIMIDRAFT_249858 [Rhizopus microsporus ATCC 52813]PHZ14954.1 hypothetical protein RHIMIDRAFT_249858 [Rhizopus microsporus ATCC 52813]